MMLLSLIPLFYPCLIKDLVLHFTPTGTFWLWLLSCLGFWCVNNFLKVYRAPIKQILVLVLVIILIFPLFFNGIKSKAYWYSSISYNRTNLNDLEFSHTIDLVENLEFSSIFGYDRMHGQATVGQIRDYFINTYIMDPVYRLLFFPVISRKISYHFRSIFSETGIKIQIINSTNLRRKQVTIQNSSSLE
ncbi:MAG: hypothetical protein ACTSWY_12945, partial [Promethearchaeota archaeon]